MINSGQKEAFLINYYNELKDLTYYKENSFFWLQFSIACTNVGRYELAQTYLDNAYISLFLKKTLYEIIVLPVTIRVVCYIKHIDGADVYDKDISYNILKINDI